VCHAAPCPICRLPLQAGEVARAGYEADNPRTVPMTYGRGEYCDHIQKPPAPPTPPPTGGCVFPNGLLYCPVCGASREWAIRNPDSPCG